MTSYDHDDPQLAATYDRISDSQFEGGKRMVERLGLRAGERVLDVGCGTGRLAAWLHQCVGPSGVVVGIDPLPERIAMARARNRGVRFEVGGAEDLGAFADGSFDAVCLNAVFHWIADKPRAFSEIRRVLRPGGRVGCTTSPKELYWSGTMPLLCAQVLAQPPFVDVLDLTAIEVMNRHLTATELANLVVEQKLDLVELHVVRRTQRFASGEAVVDFAQASSFGNFLRIVPEGLRDQLRRDLAAAFDRIRTAEGIDVRTFGALLVADTALATHAFDGVPSAPLAL